jgi:hypothetical protein
MFSIRHKLAWAEDESKEFMDLAQKRTIGFGQASQAGFSCFSEQQDQASLCIRAFGCRTVFEQFFLKTFRSQRLTATPTTCVARDFVAMIIDNQPIENLPL